MLCVLLITRSDFDNTVALYDRLKTIKTIAIMKFNQNRL